MRPVSGDGWTRHDMTRITVGKRLVAKQRWSAKRHAQHFEKLFQSTEVRTASGTTSGAIRAGPTPAAVAR